jgi:oligosaccharide repeat unit polymerase
VVLLAMLGSVTLIRSINEPWAGVTGLAVLAGTAVVVGKLDLLHPYTWYSPFFFLYHASIPALIWAGVRFDRDYSQGSLLLAWLALAAFLVVVGPGRKPWAPEPEPLRDLAVPAWMLFVLSLGVTFLYLKYIWSAGFVSKLEIARSDSPLARLDPAFSTLTLAFAVLLARRLLQGRFPWSLVCLAFGWALLDFGISGERDHLLRLGWVTVLLIHTLYRRIPKMVLLGLTAAGLVLIPVLGSMKNLLIRQDVPAAASAAPATLLFADEFTTASDNLQRLLEESVSPPLLGATLSWDIRQAVLPGFLVGWGSAPTTRFNLEFFPEVVEQGGGRGFTLVGEGYMNFGAPGVALWFVILGCFVRWLYRKGVRNVLWLIMYVVSMPLILYVTRADFSNLLAQFGKHIALPMLALYGLKQTLLVARRHGVETSGSRANLAARAP